MTHARNTRKVIAYMMSRFPVTTETFILYEILELERRGWRVEVFPLLPRRASVSHPGSEGVVARAHATPYLSLALLKAQLYWLSKRPGAYLRAWTDAISGNCRSPGFLARALIVVPRAALFARQMDALGVQQIHAHWATHPTLAAFIIQRLSGIPYSFTAHAHDLYVDRSMLAEKLEEASFIATISEYNRGLLRELYGDEEAAKVSVVRCGVDFSIFRPPASRPEVTPAHPFTFVCVASLQDYKGQRFLLDACAALKQRGVAFRCLLIGDGQERAKLEEQRRALGLEQEVSMLGQRPRDAVQETLALAHAMVLPSIITRYGKKEGIPVALMEALATELPVIATRISGIPELIVDGVTGMLVPEQDSAALADAMETLVRSPARGTRLGAAGRARVLEEFSLQTNVSRLEKLLQQVQPRLPTGYPRAERDGGSLERRGGQPMPLERVS